jgi:hypothetical protein
MAESKRVKIGEATVNWFYADAPLRAKWRMEGGDYLDSTGARNGPTAFAAKTISVQRPTGYTEFDVTDLTQKLLVDNTGYFVHTNTSPGPAVFSKESTTDKPPKLVVQTTKGVYVCPLLVDAHISASSNSLGSWANMNIPLILKFDLSGVQGTVKQATLSIFIFVLYRVPQTVMVDYLDPPIMIDDPANQGYVVEKGIADATPEDKLKQHKDVLFYNSMSSLDEIKKTFYVNPAFNNVSLAAGGYNFGKNKNGVDYIRVWSRADGDNPNLVGTPQVMRADGWFQPKNSAAGPKDAPWKRDWKVGESLGYDELSQRFVIKVGEDVKNGMTELGMKLFTTNGRYEWGNFTPGIPSLDDADRFEYMLWHGPVSPANPGVYRLCTYDYDVGHSFRKNPSNGDIRPTEGYLREGKEYLLEQYVRLNTIVYGIPQPNGIHKVWLNGCLVYSDTTRIIRRLPHVQIQGVQAQIYHGGMSKPKAKFHYDISRVCVATKYIGEAKFATTQPSTGDYMASPNNTKIPPAAEIVSNAGAVYTLVTEGTKKYVYKDGVKKNYGACIAIKKVDPYIWVQGDSGKWYYINAADTLSGGQTAEPGGQAPGTEPPVLVSLLPLTSSKPQGATASLTVSINQSQGTPITVYFTTSDPAVATVSQSTIIQAGSTTGLATVNFVGIGSAIITAVLGSGPSMTVDVTTTEVGEDLPPFVPAPGFYREVTLNTPYEVLPPNFSDYNTANRVLANYTGGALVRKFGLLGGVAYRGGGEHGYASDSCATLVWDIALRMYVWRARGAFPHTQSMGFATDPDPTDLWGFHKNDGAAGASHTYSFLTDGFEEGGELVQAGGNNSGSTDRALQGETQPVASNSYWSVTKHDLTQEVGGNTRLAPAGIPGMRYGLSVDWGGNYGGADTDYKREGWWSKPGTGGGQTSLMFIKRNGEFFESPNKYQMTRPMIRHITFAGQDILAFFYIGNADYFALLDLAQGGQAYTFPPANWNWVSRTSRITGTPPVLTAAGYSYVTDAGPRWTDTYTRFYCMDHMLSVPKIFSMVPTDPYQLMTCDWVWSSEEILSEDGSVIVPNNDVTDCASSRGINGKLVEIPAHKSLAWTRSAGARGQYIRPSWMV